MLDCRNVDVSGFQSILVSLPDDVKSAFELAYEPPAVEQGTAIDIFPQALLEGV